MNAPARYEIEVYRRAARVILIAPDQRVLMIRGHDADDYAHSWWFTPGGGLKPGEGSRAGAARELAEESGFIAPLHELTGPVLRRRALFKFVAKTWVQDEEFYLWRPREYPGDIRRDAWTDREQNVLDEMRWFSLRELRALADQRAIYPEGFVDLFAAWVGGWDGQCALINTAADAEFSGVDVPPWDGDAGGSGKSL